MGCDIHLYVERRVDGKWMTADKWSKNKYHEKYPEDNEPEMCIEWEDRFYSGRNYNLFAILAGVRNGRGFAGCKTGEGFVPISEPRGVPDDACPEYKAEVDRWDGDGHSHSYFTVAELMAYDWNQTSILHGVVNALGYHEWARERRDAGQPPEIFCGAVFGQNIKNITEAKMIRMLRGKTKEEISELRDYYCRISWQQKYHDCAEEFLKETIPKLQAIGNPNDVRIVFFFDN